MKKIQLFESSIISESKLRFVFGGANYTTKVKQDDDFRDNCGWTTYSDCSEKTGDGLP